MDLNEEIKYLGVNLLQGINPEVVIAIFQINKIVNVRQEGGPNSNWLIGIMRVDWDLLSAAEWSIFKVY